MNSVYRVFVYHSAKSDKLLRRMYSALAKQAGRVVVFVSRPEDADAVYGAYISDDGKHRVLRRLGVK